MNPNDLMMLALQWVGAVIVCAFLARWVWEILTDKD